LSKLKPPEGVFESRPMSGLVNSDIVYFGVASMKYLFLLVCTKQGQGRLRRLSSNIQTPNLEFWFYWDYVNSYPYVLFRLYLHELAIKFSTSVPRDM
jgi:hypothetical protein